MIRRAAFILSVVLLVLVPLASHAGASHEVFFKGSDHELHVYHSLGVEAGPTLMIMGGIQGDEPGGYLAADLYADMRLKKGNLIVVPRANFYSILVNQRGPNGDMNRKFAGDIPIDPDSEVVTKIKELMQQADYFLNMHDGSGFYHPEYIDPMHNPRRFGQSIITDTDRYILPSGEVIDLAEMAERVIQQVNPAIHEAEYRFHYNNHRTLANDSLHKEQRKSATYYVLTSLNKPAFASESSKEIKDFRKRVVFQTMVVNAFMKEIGIIPEQPSIYIDPPLMEYALLSINNGNPIAVHDDQHIVINKGDTLTVADIKTNYKRGVVADIRGVGNINDMDGAFTIENSTTIDIKKDAFPCGRIHVDVISEIRRTWLILEADHVLYALGPEGSIPLPRGAVIVLRDLIYNGNTNHGLIVNFKGFVSNWNDNTGEDRGYPINTSNLLGRYANIIDAHTQRYRISAMRGDSPVVSFYIDIKE